MIVVHSSSVAVLISCCFAVKARMRFTRVRFCMAIVNVFSAVNVLGMPIRTLSCSRLSLGARPMNRRTAKGSLTVQAPLICICD